MPLNKKQTEAVNTIDGQLLVIACPGSGKTTTMVHRIHNIIETKKVSPKSIIMMTFSKASAEDMRKRYEAEYKERGVIFCTLHSFCFSTLKACKIVTNDSLLAESEKYSLLWNILGKIGNFPEKKDFVSNLVTDIGNVKKTMVDPMAYIPQSCDKKELFQQIYQIYQKTLRETNKIDFEDMLLLTLKLFKERPAYVEKLRNAYKYIQIDEYQDTSRIQMEILYLLAGPDGNIACVGDDDQCIYSFAGASPDVMMDFTKHYPKAKLINLDTNYRSGKAIIDAAKDVIEYNPGRYSKKFIAGRDIDGDLNILTQFSNKKQQYQTAVKEIQQLLANHVSTDDIAVLYRTKQQGELFSRNLMDTGVPFYSLEQLPSKYESFIFQDILKYHALAEGETLSINDLYLIVNKPARYISMSYLRNGLDRQFMIQQALKISDKWKRERQISQINDLFVFLDCLHGKSPAEFLKYFDVMGYERYLKKQEEFRNLGEGELFEILEEYKKDIESNDLTTWNAFIGFAQRYNANMKDANKKHTGITLSTMHKSKGLEWKNVILVDCVEGICPLKKAVSDREKEEERRLFYVAMTRAKDRLWLFGYESKNQKEQKQRKGKKKANIGISRYVLNIRQNKKTLCTGTRDLFAINGRKKPKTVVYFFTKK